MTPDYARHRARFLRATATYTDNAMNPADDPDTPPAVPLPGCGDDDESSWTVPLLYPPMHVQAEDNANEPPEFPDQDDHNCWGREKDQTRDGARELRASATEVGSRSYGNEDDEDL